MKQTFVSRIILNLGGVVLVGVAVAVVVGVVVVVVVIDFWAAVAGSCSFDRFETFNIATVVVALG